MTTQETLHCSQCRHENLASARFCSFCGTSLGSGAICGVCSAPVLEASAQFCNQCGSRLEEAVSEAAPAQAPREPAVSVAPTPEPAPVPAALPPMHAHAEALEEFSLPPMEILSHKAHRSQLFYAQVFAVLAVITIVEIGIFYVEVAAFKVPSLILLSTAKFALVAMFFMHLKGDRRLFSTLFVGPFFIAAAILVSLVGLFRNF